MSRSLRVEWNDSYRPLGRGRSPWKPFTKRIRWYQGDTIRLELLDKDGCTQVYFQNDQHEDAQRLYDDFKIGTETSQTVRRKDNWYEGGTKTGKDRRTPG